ncbi:hypothetical protein JCM10908_003786 [Rhodotorula pacifica]|uniref:protein serine/threonine phosphatase n=1 Tax=Rhodotorula pacifica TaxID=1495444 RepID=UPI00316FBD36
MELPATHLRLAAALPYPLTVQRIHAQPGHHVNKTQRLFTYSFLPSRPDEQGKRERQVREWDSPVQGQVIAWDVREGDIIREPRPVVKIQEPCTHDVQLNGLCAICGKDLTATDYTGFSDTSRATISMVHDVGGLTVSMEEAHRLESATASRLLQAKKLSLIVDLDQTIVHATVDPTVGEWLQDPSNPNYKALEGVKRFKLLDEMPMMSRRPKRSRTSTGTTTPGLVTPLPTPGLSESGTTEDGESIDEDDAPGCYYYIKMRPGLADFLKRIAEIYEMHVYTMGTRAYAIEVCKVIDPDGGLFGGRILSRDESGSMTRKSLQRLFPCDTNMVVIIDDRADVWDGSPNLVKVIPYEFFVGIGDINAAFLPKKKELVPPPVVPLASPSLDEVASSLSEGSASPLDSAMAGSDASPGGERSTTPLTSPSPGPPVSPIAIPTSTAAAEAAVHHLHLPDEILSEPTRISDLVVSSAPEEVVSPSMKEASEHAKETIHDLIEARPLEKARREADALHHANHTHAPSSPKSPSRSPLPPSPTTGAGATLAGAPPAAGGEAEDVTTTAEPAAAAETDAMFGFAGEETDDDDYEEQPVLRDDDRELDRLFDILSNVRDRFYEEHEARGASDVANIIPDMKAQALRDTNIVFSGLVALGTQAEDSEYWKLATTFGAKCSNILSPKVTHLVANQPGTAKVHSAKRFPRVKVVYPQWLLDSVAKWVRLDEAPYLLPLAEERPTTPPSPVRPELSDGEGDAAKANTGINTPSEVGNADDLDLADLDWGDAMKEVDDLLLETDDDDDDLASVLNGSNGGDHDTTDGESDAGGPPPTSGRKRPRISTTLSDSAGDSSSKGSSHAAESPLQKRVKTARSRRSGLKTSLSAAEGEALVRAEAEAEASRVKARDEAASVAAATQGRTSSSTTNGSSRDSPSKSALVVEDNNTAADASQASSSFGSDDEDLLAMAADLESGWD